MSLFKKHPYLELNMGLVNENFIVIKRKDLKLWEERGFQKIRKYPIFGYRPNLSEVIMLGKPLTISEFGTEHLLHSRILGFTLLAARSGILFCSTFLIHEDSLSHRMDV